MKIISENESVILINNIIKKHSDTHHIDFYSIWLKIRKYINVLIIFLSSILAIIFFKVYKTDILSFLNIVQLNIFWRLFIALIGFILILILTVIMVIVHEWIHIIGSSICRIPSLVVFNKPIGLSILNIEWISKKQELFILSLPVVVILIIAIVVGLICNNILIFAWITLINLALASSDIVNFIIVLLKIPKDSLILGHYYRHQQ